jgi:hypothetical protein
VPSVTPARMRLVPGSVTELPNGAAETGLGTARTRAGSRAKRFTISPEVFG